MLDSATKRRIDTARDILVGKVPDPKSQVEQITIALIYKFMDDMDAQSEQLGGKRSFFADGFTRYGWTKLMRTGLGGHDTLNLYTEAITRMPENPGIPPLFRDIFKNAYLPYRDPETLRNFLKVIDEFEYDHSERLGDAFEYLLSVLGSQGDAGQFRTPRHIIDFIVAVIDPKKDETLLDPACGTAGFLISSYKHVIKANTDKHGHGTLTPDEKNRLADNFKGYDISPDMVRLSLVNMYLHGFAAPHIFEYDTLTSQDRWNDYADVILANPPFMSPKGGIRPHNRFSVKSKRSEVLFVDYMAEHLTPNGRAGIIVPEGIIFQSQNAHKQLRKMLVEGYLVAVVSLPAGVFQPYSGVKTSILILDRSLAKKTDHIGFFKIENDGFDLGAQRRKIDKDDLPQAHEEISAYLHRLRAEESMDDFQPTLGLIVEKEKIAADGEYNLSGERYRENRASNSQFEMVSLGDVCDIRKGTAITRKEVVEGQIPVIAGGQKPSTFHNKANRTGETITVSASGAYAGFVSYFNEPIFASDCSTIKSKDGLLISTFVFHALKFKQSEIYKLQVGMGQPHVYPKDLSSFQIPLPPLEVQQEIVAEIEGYQKVIDGARAVIDNYRPHIPIDPDWPMVALGEVCNVKGGKRLPKGEQLMESPTNHPYLRVSDFRDQSINLNSLKFVSEGVHEKIARYTISSADVYVSIAGTVGIWGTIPNGLDGANLTENAAKLSFDKTRLDKRFLSIIGNGEFIQNQVRSLTHMVGVPKLALERVKTLQFPLPPLKTQQSIVAEVETEQALVTANEELIKRMEDKVQTAISRVWGK